MTRQDLRDKLVGDGWSPAKAESMIGFLRAFGRPGMSYDELWEAYRSTVDRREARDDD